MEGGFKSLISCSFPRFELGCCLLLIPASNYDNLLLEKIDNLAVLVSMICVKSAFNPTVGTMHRAKRLIYFCLTLRVLGMEEEGHSKIIISKIASNVVKLHDAYHE